MKRFKALRKWLWPLLLAALLVFALTRLDTQSLLHSVRQIPIWTIFLLLCLQIISQLLVNLQWHQIAKRFDINISFGKMLDINSRGNVIDAVTPGVKIGGEVTRAMQLKKVANGSGAQSAAVVAIQKLFSISALCLLVLITVGSLVDHLSPLVYVFPFGLLVLIICIFIMPSRIYASFQKKAPAKWAWRNKFRSFLMTVTGHLSSLSKKALILFFLLSLLIWLLYPVKLFILATQLVPNVGLFGVGAIAFASYIVAMLPIFPGGLGGFEATMVGLFLAIGLIVSDAAVITILFRFLTFWLVMLLSLAYIGCFTLWKKQKLK